MNVTRKHRKDSEKQMEEKEELQADQLRKTVYCQIARERKRKENGKRVSGSEQA